MKDLESATWFKDEICLLKKGPKAQPCIPPEEQFNLDGTSVVKNSWLTSSVHLEECFQCTKERNRGKNQPHPQERMTPMNQRKDTREKLFSPTMKKPKGTLHPRALTPHQRIVTAPAKKDCVPIPLSMTMRG